MDVKSRRKHPTEKLQSTAKRRYKNITPRSPLPADHQLSSSSTAGVRSVLRRVLTWMEQTAVFSWLRHALEGLKHIISDDQSWPVVLVQGGLLVCILSYLHMDLPCLLFALVYWIYDWFRGGPELPNSELNTSPPLH